MRLLLTEGPWGSPGVLPAGPALSSRCCSPPPCPSSTSHLRQLLQPSSSTNEASQMFCVSSSALRPSAKGSMQPRLQNLSMTAVTELLLCFSLPLLILPLLCPTRLPGPCSASPLCQPAPQGNSSVYSGGMTQNYF